MREQLFARFDIVDTPKNLAIDRCEAISHAVDTLGRMEGNRFLPKFELGALAVQASLRGKAQGLPKSIDFVLLLADSHLRHSL